MNQTFVLFPTPHNEPTRKLDNDVIPSSGIEPATLRSLVWQSKQLSYAARDDMGH